MERLIEIGDLEIVRDIPDELFQLESVNKTLKIDLKKKNQIINFLALSLVGIVIYCLIKESNKKKEDTL